MFFLSTGQSIHADARPDPKHAAGRNPGHFARAPLPADSSRLRPEEPQDSYHQNTVHEAPSHGRSQATCAGRMIGEMWVLESSFAYAGESF